MIASGSLDLRTFRFVFEYFFKIHRRGFNTIFWSDLHNPRNFFQCTEHMCRKNRASLTHTQILTDTGTAFHCSAAETGNSGKRGRGRGVQREGKGGRSGGPEAENDRRSLPI